MSFLVIVSGSCGSNQKSGFGNGPARTPSLDRFAAARIRTGRRSCFIASI